MFTGIWQACHRTGPEPDMELYPQEYALLGLNLWTLLEEK